MNWPIMPRVLVVGNLIPLDVLGELAQFFAHIMLDTA